MIWVWHYFLVNNDWRSRFSMAYYDWRSYCFREVNIHFETEPILRLLLSPNAQERQFEYFTYSNCKIKINLQGRIQNPIKHLW